MRITDFVLTHTPLEKSERTRVRHKFDVETEKQIKERLTRESARQIAKSMGVKYHHIWQVQSAKYGK